MLFKRKGINTHLVLVDEDCDGCLGLRTERKNRSELLNVEIVLAIERTYVASVRFIPFQFYFENAWVRVLRRFMGLYEGRLNFGFTKSRRKLKELYNII